MSQFPHDEFDDVAPYRADEIGKHRAAGGAAEKRRRGGLKWIGIFAALALVIGLGAYFYQDILGSDDADDEQAAESDAASDAAQDEDGEEGDSESEEASEEEALEEEDPVEPFDVVVYNFDFTEGAAANVSDQLQNAGIDVASLENWNNEWNTCGETAPLVVYPSDAAEQAQEVADTLGAATCENDAWTRIAVAVGANSMQ